MHWDVWQHTPNLCQIFFLLSSYIFVFWLATELLLSIDHVVCVVSWRWKTLERKSFCLWTVRFMGFSVLRLCQSTSVKQLHWTAFSLYCFAIKSIQQWLWKHCEDVDVPFHSSSHASCPGPVPFHPQCMCCTYCLIINSPPSLHHTFIVFLGLRYLVNIS